jgi:hypothetical protein
MKNALSYFLVFLGVQAVIVAAAGQLNGLLDTMLIHVLAVGVSALVTITLFCLLRWATPTKDYILTRPWSTLLWSAIAAVGCIIPSVFLQEFIVWPQSWLELFNTKETEELLSGMMATTGGFFVIAILQPLAEELVFRGAILRSLLKWKPERRWLMIALSALLFALAHMNPMQFIHPLLIGLLLGWMYERTHSIIPGVLFHWVNNTVAVVATILYADKPDFSLTDLWGPQRVYLAVGFSLLILLPALYQLHLLMKRPSSQKLF